MARIRLDKYLSDAMNLSRREAREMIRAGRVSVEGAPVLSEGFHLPENALVTADGNVLRAPGPCYIMMNKPAGVLSATEDPRQSTVLDLVPPELRRRNLFPVGRLDKDTTGLLLLTDDGEFAHRIISPRSGISKLYLARVEGRASRADVEAFAAGLTLSDGTKCLPAGLEILGEGLLRVEVCEGRYHQVKRMLASRGLPVLSLHRERIGGLMLDATLMVGQCKMLSPDEVQLLFCSSCAK